MNPINNRSSGANTLRIHFVIRTAPAHFGRLTVNNHLELTAAHVESHIESMRRTLRVVLEELMEAKVAFTNLETLIAALLCNGVTPQEIAFLIAESIPSPSTATQTSRTLKIEEFKLQRHESVN